MKPKINTLELGKLPPQAIDLEEAVLGALMLEKDALNTAIDKLKPESFYKDAHQKIFSAIHNLFQNNAPVDSITVMNELKSTGDLEVIGGAFYLTQLTNRIASTANTEYHSHIILQKYFMRELISLNNEIVSDAYEDTTDVFDLIGKYYNKMSLLLQSNFPTKEKGTAELIKEFTERTEQAAKSKEEGKVIGVPSDLKDLDQITGGWQPGDLIIIAARPGMGKCLGKGTRVLMFDGTLKKVEDIIDGDVLMGDDSSPRKVLSINKGREKMYWIRQNKGIDYRVNKSHILSLKRSRTENCHKHGDILNIEVRDYLTKSDKFKSNYKGYKVGVKFKSKLLPFDPYFFGIWLGDGHSLSSRITCSDKEIIDYLKQYADNLKLKLVKYTQKERCDNYAITKGWQGKEENVFSLHGALRKLNLLNNKHIPNLFLINSEENRLKLLAGIIDSDGYYCAEYNVFEIVQKRKELTEQIKFLADTLGFRTSFKSKKATIKDRDFKCTVYRVRISGNLDIIPTRVERKKARKSKLVNSFRHTGIKVEYDKVDEYYGFEIDGNKLFLLEDMTVTHNTAFMKACTRKAVSQLQKPILIFSLEMSSYQLTARIVSEEINIPAQNFLKGDIPSNFKEKVDGAVKKYYSNDGRDLLIIDDTPALSISQITHRSKKIMADHNISMILVDYIQLAGEDKTVHSNNREQDISAISRGLKALAKELKIPIIALSQLNREVEKRGSKMIPKLADLRESGAIEQDADIVIFLYRPRYYFDMGHENMRTIKVNDIEIDSEGYAQLIIAKNRNGATGRIHAKFINHLTKFEDWDGGDGVINFSEPAGNPDDLPF